MNRQLDIFRNALLSQVEDAPKQYPAPLAPLNSFFTFRYSCTEISAQGGNAQVRRRETRFEDGRLVNEEFEGTVDREAYTRMVDQAQQHFANQMTQMMKLFFLPYSFQRSWNENK